MKQGKDEGRARLVVLLELLYHLPIYQQESFRTALHQALESAIIKAFLVK